MVRAFDVVAVSFQIVPEVLRHGFRILMSVALPFSPEHGVQTFMVDGLFLVAPDGVNQLDQLAVEHAGSVTDELLLGLLAEFIRGLRTLCGRLDLARLLLDAVRVDGLQQNADDVGEFKRRWPAP